MALNNTSGIQNDGKDDMREIPGTPNMETARSPPTNEERAGIHGPIDQGIPNEQPARHARAQDSEEENEEVADAQDDEAIVHEPQQAKVSPVKRENKISLPLQQTTENRRRFEATMRRGLLSAAENNTPLPQWLRRHGASRLGNAFVRLRAELLAPERDQARIARMLAGAAEPNQQDANQDEGADGPEAAAEDGGEDVKAAVRSTGEKHLPARDHVGDEL